MEISSVNYCKSFDPDSLWVVTEDSGWEQYTYFFDNFNEANEFLKSQRRKTKNIKYTVVHYEKKEN